MRPNTIAGCHCRLYAPKSAIRNPWHWWFSFDLRLMFYQLCFLHSF